MTTVLLPGNILYGGESVIKEARSSLSVGDFILKKLKSHDNATLMINAATDDRYTAKYIYDASVRLSYVLRHLGVEANDVIAICSENSIECVIAYIAALGINATVALLNVAYTERELKHALTLVQPKLVFGSTKSMGKIYTIAKNMKSVKHLINLTARKNTKEIYSFEQLMKHQKIHSESQIIQQQNVNKAEDVAVIFYSSGTTGQAKGVQLTHNNILNAFDVALAAGQMPQLKVALNVLPWCHVYGSLRLLYYIVVGRTQIYRDHSTGQQILKAIEQYKVNEAILVPPYMVFLAKDPSVKNYDLSTLLLILCGAAAVKKEVINEIKKRTNALILQGYGLSETTTGVIGNSPFASNPDSIGTVKTDMYAKVVDPDTGIALGFNQPGEICFKGYAIMKGYVGDSQATTNVIRDGWLHSGDIGYYNEHFEFFLVDRLKELIKYKGNQVPPAELEAILLSNPEIIDAAVIGKPDDEAGELPMAFVVKAANSKITEKEIMDYIADRVAPMKRLRGGVVFVNEIPKTNTGKILRRELRKRITNPKSKL